jgi:predicted GIY-YIG superfamily endonuclease
MKKKRQAYTPAQKAQKKIMDAKWRQENKEAQKIYQAEWYQDNREEQQRQVKEWQKANPDYIPPCRIENPDYVSPSAVNLGYWVVYLIKNYNGLGDTYCGQTQNIYRRMAAHKCIGRLNTDTYTIVKKCDTLEDALELESAVHNFGYHGDARTESGK